MDKLNRINEDPAFLNLIDYEQDNKMLMNTMKRRAREEGLQEGREEGIVLGREEGIELGREEGVLSVAKNLLLLGTDIHLISKATGLSSKEIMSLKE